YHVERFRSIPRTAFTARLGARRSHEELARLQYGEGLPLLVREPPAPRRRRSAGRLVVGRLASLLLAPLLQEPARGTVDPAVGVVAIQLLDSRNHCVPQGCRQAVLAHGQQ